MKCSLILGSALVGLVASAPAIRRDEVTVTDMIVVTVIDIVTIFGDAPVAATTSSPTSLVAPSSAPAPAPAPIVTSSSISAAAAPVAPAPAPTSTSKAAAVAPIATPTTTSTPATVIQVAPASSSSPAPAAQAPASSPPAAPSSVSSSSSSSSGAVNLANIKANAGATLPSQPAAKSGPYSTSTLTGASVPDGCTAGSPCMGKVTYYSPSVGTGTCGQTFQDTQDIIAVAADMMGSISNGDVTNELCWRYINLYNPDTKKTARGMVTDKCPGCSGQGLDLSPSLFDQLGVESVGHYDSVQWAWA